MLAKMSPTSPRGIMPEADRQPVDPLPPHAQRARLLAEHGGHGERRGEAEDARPGEARRSVHAHAHEHEEDRHEEARRCGSSRLSSRAPLAAVPKVLVVHLLEDEPGGEGADDRRQARPPRRATRARSRSPRASASSTPSRAGGRRGGTAAARAQRARRAIAPTRKATALPTMTSDRREREGVPAGGSR